MKLKFASIDLAKHAYLITMSVNRENKKRSNILRFLQIKYFETCQFITKRTFFPNPKIFFQAITAK